MKIVTTGIAGTLESSDVLVTVIPPSLPGLEIELESVVKKQFGEQIIKVVRETLERLEVADAYVSLQDKGALDCTIRARTEAAVYRGAGSTTYRWGKAL